MMGGKDRSRGSISRNHSNRQSFCRYGTGFKSGLQSASTAKNASSEVNSSEAERQAGISRLTALDHLQWWICVSALY